MNVTSRSRMRMSAWSVPILILASVFVAALTMTGCSPAQSRSTRSSSARARSLSHKTSTPTSAPTTTTTTTTVPSYQQAGKLGLGDSGPAVLALQQRLTALGYWVGTVDGKFGDSTQQAVYALQKAAGISRDGIEGPNTAAALTQGVVPHPRSTSGYVIEVDLTSDIVMIVSNGKLDYVLNTSTGGGYRYSDKGVTAVAITPVGTFHVYRQVDGLVTDYLGQLWRPKFFDSGFAIHGDNYVPPYPVSHGCVRVSNEAIDWIWSNNIAPIGTEVWVYT